MENKKPLPPAKAASNPIQKDLNLTGTNFNPKLVSTSTTYNLRIRKLEIKPACSLKNSQNPLTKPPAQSKNPPKTANNSISNSKTNNPFDEQDPSKSQPTSKPSLHRDSLIDTSEKPQISDSELDRFKFGPQIGKGSYAVVKLATDTLEDEKVAIKLYDKYKLTDPQKKKNVQREIQVLKRIQHPNCIEIKKTFETSKSICVVMEYVGKDSLYTYLKKFEQRKLPEDEAKRIFKQLIRGVSYLHENNIIHRDLKLENLLMDDTKNIKIIDFGFSVIAPSDTVHSVLCGTPSYMAPEIVSKKDYLGPPVDVWACGIILYVMMAGCFPFRSPDEKTLFAKIQNGIFEMPDNISTGAKQVLKKLLNVDPNTRVTAAEIFQDTWVSPMNICKKIGELKALIEQQRQSEMKKQEQLGEGDKEESKHEETKTLKQ